MGLRCMAGLMTAGGGSVRADALGNAVGKLPELFPVIEREHALDATGIDVTGASRVCYIPSESVP